MMLFRARPFVSALAVTIGVVAVLGAAVASAATSWSWGPFGAVDSHSLTDLSCLPAVCVATDVAGNVVSSSDPLAGTRGWTIAHVDGSNTLSGVACVSASLCVAVDWAGNVVSSSDPLAGSRGWTVAHVDGSNALSGVACVSASLCVAVDQAGNVVSSSDPLAGPGAWAVAHVDDNINYECVHYSTTGPDCQAALLAVSCPSGELCVATDSAGYALSSTDPAGGTDAWSSTNGSLGDSEPLTGLSCPTTSLCAAVDTYGGHVLTWNPQITPVIPNAALVGSESGLFGLTCQTSKLCFTWDDAGTLFDSETPAGSASSWAGAPVHAGGYVTAVSCPSANVCLAVDYEGDVSIGIPPTETRRDEVALTRLLKAVRAAVLHQRHPDPSTHPVQFDAPSRGQLVLSWQQSGSKRPTTRLASLGRELRAGRTRVTLHLTAAGQRLLAKTRPASIAETGRFTFPHGPTVTATLTFLWN